MVELGVLAWSFRIYAAHLEKGCLLLGLSSAWRTKAVVLAGRGLAKAGDRSFSPRPAVTRHRLVQPATTRGWNDSFAIFALVGCAFLLQVPSGSSSSDEAARRWDLSSDER